MSVGEGAWSASEAIGRFAIIAFATPMALVMKMLEAAQLRKRALSEALPQPAMLIRHKNASVTSACLPSVLGFPVVQFSAFLDFFLKK